MAGMFTPNTSFGLRRGVSGSGPVALSVATVWLSTNAFTAAGTPPEALASVRAVPVSPLGAVPGPWHCGERQWFSMVLFGPWMKRSAVGVEHPLVGTGQ